MQACVDWVLIIFGTQVIKKKRPVRPVFPDYLSVSYDYAAFNHQCFQVYFDSQCTYFLLVKKIMLFSCEKVVITQFDTGGRFYAPVYAK